MSFTLPSVLTSARGVIGSMAFEYTGDRLRVVWFRWSHGLDRDLEDGRSLSGQAHESYIEAKRRRADRGRRVRRAARREAVL